MIQGIDWFARTVSVITLAITTGVILLGWIATYLKQVRQQGIMDFLESNYGKEFMYGYLDNWFRSRRGRK